MLKLTTTFIYLSLFQIFLFSAELNIDRYNIPDLSSINKESFFIENMRKSAIPENKIRDIKLVETYKAYNNYLISYDSVDKKLYALMSIPTSKKPGNGYPVVIVNHGYIPPEQYSTLRSYRLVTGYYASNGFLTLKPDYRGFGSSIKQSDKDFFERINYVYDVLYLINAVKSISEADPENIFMYGHSMGGDVTLRTLEITGLVKAATLWAPVSAAFPENTLHYMRKRSDGSKNADTVNTLLNKYFTNEDFEKMSGLTNTSYIKTPLILHHGTLDDSVPYEWSTELMKEFDKNKVNYKFYSYKGEDHNFARGAFYKVLKTDVDFFKSFLK